MKSAIDLLEDYKAEKTMIIGAPDERTGLEPFPSFKEWKDEYVKDYVETHMEVDEETADELMDALIEEADLELEKLALTDPEAVVEEDEEEEEVEVKVEPAKKESKVARKAPLKPRAKKTKPVYTTKKAAKKPSKTVSKAVSKPKAKPAKKAGTSKKDVAQKVFDRYFGKKERKFIIAKFLEKGLTAAGASTYYASFKKKAES